MPDTYFTSYNHWSHSKVIGYANRPFANVDEMDEAMITNWNSRVRPGDLVYHCGDFALCSADKATRIARRLNGNKYIVFGNHDRAIRKDAEFLKQWVWSRD